MKISEDTPVSMPMKNLLSIIGSVAIGVYFAFGVIERLNIIEVELQLMQQDLLEASTQKPIDQEQFMLLEYLAKDQDKLKSNVEAEMPQIQRVDMQVQFLEERIIDLETLVDKLRNNGTH